MAANNPLISKTSEIDAEIPDVGFKITHVNGGLQIADKVAQVGPGKERLHQMLPNLSL